MKYVILEHHALGKVIVAGCLVTHEELCAGYRAKGFVAKSAGFFRILADRKFHTFGFSVSLNLTPNREDARLIELFHNATLKTAPEVPEAPIEGDPTPNFYSYTTTVAKGTSETSSHVALVAPGLSTVTANPEPLTAPSSATHHA